MPRRDWIRDRADKLVAQGLTRRMAVDEARRNGALTHLPVTDDRLGLGLIVEAEDDTETRGYRELHIADYVTEGAPGRPAIMLDHPFDDPTDEYGLIEDDPERHERRRADHDPIPRSLRHMPVWALRTRCGMPWSEFAPPRTHARNGWPRLRCQECQTGVHSTLTPQVLPMIDSMLDLAATEEEHDTHRRYNETLGAPDALASSPPNGTYSPAVEAHELQLGYLRNIGPVLARLSDTPTPGSHWETRWALAEEVGFELDTILYWADPYESVMAAFELSIRLLIDHPTLTIPRRRRTRQRNAAIRHIRAGMTGDADAYECAEEAASVYLNDSYDLEADGWPAQWPTWLYASLLAQLTPSASDGIHMRPVIHVNGDSIRTELVPD